MNDRELISFSVKEEDYGYQEREIIILGKAFHTFKDSGKYV